MNREKFSSRLGFLLISAGCAVGLGNVWRFPYITGKYGGAAFVLFYLFFLFILGLPIMTMEFSVGRASQKSSALSFDVLQPKGTKWKHIKYITMLGNYLLMMFYTTVGGWMLAYFFKMVKGEFIGLPSEQISGTFHNMLENPLSQIFWMVAIVLIGFGICSKGLQNGVEKISKYMMSFLFLVMIILVIRAVTLPNALEGLKFYLIPDFSSISDNLIEVIFAAMGQAFFSLSLGIGSLAVFGSYIGKSRRLLGESINITLLDTIVAIIAGFIIFPACFAYNVNPNEGPGLVFITLPNIFNNMPLGQLWGSLFFVFMTFAALTTIVAVFENIISYAMDLTGCSRKKAVCINILIIIILSLPCALGFNLLSGIQPLGAGSTIQDLEDFIVSSNLLPIGAILYLLFCTTRYGWGWKNFIQEVNTGKGLKFPKMMRIYVSYILPLIVLFIFFQGYISKFPTPWNWILPILIICVASAIPILSFVAYKKEKEDITS